MTYTVTQADRDAAAAISNFGRRIKDLILSGEYDDHPFVQAFARHRIETLERAAEVAMQYASDYHEQQDYIDIAAVEIATEIHNLKWKSDE